MEEMDEKQSLKIITQMIDTAKNNLGNNSFHFLLWGWAVLIASMSHYFLWTNGIENHFLPWPILMTITGIIAGIKGYKDSKSSAGQGYIAKFIGILWMFIALAIVLSLVVISYVAGFKASYAAVMLLYGLGTLITGTIIQFRPLIVGGIIIWLCSTSLIWLDFPEVLLVLAFSIIAGYIVPGYILRNKRERKVQLAA